jgi:hypothetical protein
VSRAGWRTLAVILAAFAAGHTLGTAAPHVTRGATEAAVFRAMQVFRFPIMGFERSYWDFYRGFALTISVQLALMAAVAWHVGSLGRRDPRQALPVAVALLLGCAGVAVISWFFFFGGPIVFSIAATILAAILVRQLATAARQATDVDHPRHPRIEAPLASNGEPAEKQVAPRM